jgi:prepilin-type N-terminal cleavage/methylation domain-containing protein
MNKRGFTLVEIMIVVLIIGLLAAIAIPNFMKARKTTHMNACKDNLRSIEGAIEQALMAPKADGSAWTYAELFGPEGFIKVEPLCPSTRAPYVPDMTGATRPVCPNPTIAGDDYEHKLDGGS